MWAWTAGLHDGKLLADPNPTLRGTRRQTGSTGSAASDASAGHPVIKTRKLLSRGLTPSTEMNRACAFRRHQPFGMPSAKPFLQKEMWAAHPCGLLQFGHFRGVAYKE